MSKFAEQYGPWAVVAGASVGIGAEFCRQIAAEGVNVVLVSRSADKLEALASELRTDHGIETRVAAADLAVPGAEAELFAATEDLELGLFVYNAGADSLNTYFLDVPAEEWHGMVRRNCVVPLLASHHSWFLNGTTRTFSVPFRNVWPSELDLMARLAGMALRERWSDWSREPFTATSASHISVWQKA